MAERASKKGIWGWMLFDWAGQPFHTLVITFIFAPYFASSLFADEATGQSVWGFLVGAAGIMVALSAPFLGAAADKTGPRKPWVFGFSDRVFWPVVGSAGGREPHVGLRGIHRGLYWRGIHDYFHQFDAA